MGEELGSAWDFGKGAGIALGSAGKGLGSARDQWESCGFWGEEQESAVDLRKRAGIGLGFWEKAGSVGDFGTGAGSGHGSVEKGLESAVDFGKGAGIALGSAGKNWNLSRILGQELEVAVDQWERDGICCGFWDRS